MKVLVADKISPKGVAYLRQQPGIEVIEAYGSSPEKVLELVKDVHAIAVRSETKITAESLLPDGPHATPSPTRPDLIESPGGRPPADASELQIWRRAGSGQKGAVDRGPRSDAPIGRYEVRRVQRESGRINRGREHQRVGRGVEHHGPSAGRCARQVAERQPSLRPSNGEGSVDAPAASGCTP